MKYKEILAKLRMMETERFRNDNDFKDAQLESVYDALSDLLAKLSDSE